MATELRELIVQLQVLERSVRTAQRGGATIEGILNDDLLPFVEETGTDVARIALLVEDSQRLAQGQANKAEAVPKKKRARHVKQRGDEEEATGADEHADKVHEAGIDEAPPAAEAEVAVPEDGEQLGKKKKKLGTKPKLGLFSPAKTPTGAIVLFDPVKVEHPRSAKKAKLVSVPYQGEANVEVLKKELKPMAFEDLDEGQKAWLLERLCLELKHVVESNLSSITAADAACLVLLTGGGAGGAVNADGMAQAAKEMYHKGDLLMLLARNAAILASYKAHRELKAREDVEDFTGQFTRALEDIVESYGVDLEVESLKRYLHVGGLFNRCAALLLCNNVKLLMTRADVVELMLDKPELARQLEGSLQRRLFELKSPLVEGEEGRLLEAAPRVEEEDDISVPKSGEEDAGPKEPAPKGPQNGGEADELVGAEAPQQLPPPLPQEEEQDGRFSLERDGFVVYQGFFAMDDVEREKLLAEARSLREDESIFNSTDREDTDRRQRLLSSMGSRVSELGQRVEASLCCLFPGYVANDTVVLTSQAGCTDQRAHCDSSPADFELCRTPEGQPALSSIVGVMQGSCVDVWAGAFDVYKGPSSVQTVFHPTRVWLNPGDLLVFRRDLVHAGCGYEEWNARLHSYLDPPGVTRSKDHTYFMDEVDWIQRKECLCNEERMWRCSSEECGSVFCLVCSGYRVEVAKAAQLSYPTDPTKRFPTYLYCRECLDDMGDALLENPSYCSKYALPIAEGGRYEVENGRLLFVASQALENQRIHDFFGGAACPFDLHSIQADGSCLVVGTASCLGEPLISFCHDLAELAIDGGSSWMRRYSQLFVGDEGGRLDANGMSVDVVQQFKSCFQRMRRCKSSASVLKPIMDSWDSVVGDAMPYLLGDFLAERRDGRQLVVHELHADGLACASRFPDREVPLEKTVNLLRWNALLPHYDLLTVH